MPANLGTLKVFESEFIQIWKRRGTPRHVMRRVADSIVLLDKIDQALNLPDIRNSESWNGSLESG